MSRLRSPSPPVPRSRLKRHTIQTLYVRVPRQDWPLVKQGRKTEFRTAGRYSTPTANLPTPCAVVLWCPVRYGPEPEQHLAVLEDAWEELLGAISPESLAREGFATIKEFKDYWRHRGNGGRQDPRAAFKPMTQVRVYRVRPWKDSDFAELGEDLLRYLYAPVLGEAS